MIRQLNLRVNDEFAQRLEILSKKIGKPMGSVLEAIGTPALESAEDDIQFEAEALAAWEEFELTGRGESATQLDALFEDALARAKAVADKKKS